MDSNPQHDPLPRSLRRPFEESSVEESSAPKEPSSSHPIVAPSTTSAKQWIVQNLKPSYRDFEHVASVTFSVENDTAGSDGFPKSVAVAKLSVKKCSIGNGFVIHNSLLHFSLNVDGNAVDLTKLICLLPLTHDCLLHVMVIGSWFS